jgi:murein DD-endopeptidase MepM/ murein hydrolase activator NlpD
MLRAFIAVVLGVLLAAWPNVKTSSVAGSFAANQQIEVRWEPGRVVNGSPCLFRVKAAKPLKALSGQWLERQVFFSYDASSREWVGFAGVDQETEAGSYPLTLSFDDADGGRSSSRHPVPVARENYPRVALSVPRKFLEPDAETLKRIQAEQELKREAFRKISSDRFWQGQFVSPLDSVTTAIFGTQRTFNGKLQSVHQGLDFRASIGTPVRAMNSGEVILAHQMFYEGGFLVIDHGQGLLTTYMHLSQFRTKVGDRVNKSQIVALSGGTGRATGPHLHVGVRWQSLYLDPAALLKLQLP